MSYLSEITFRRGLGLFVLVLTLLSGGTWLIAKVATDHLLNEDATQNARDWAGFLAANVPDLEQIAAGEQPSVSSLAFFEATRKAGQVFRYVIFNREGYSQLVSDHSRIAQVDLSTYSAEAARATKTGQPVVDVKTGHTNKRPAYFAEAFVPVVAGGRPVAVVAAFVDETEKRDDFYEDFLVGAAALCLLTTLSFGVPAVAWYRRTREKQRADRRIHFLAHHDALTGLANRARLIERLDSALAIPPSVGGHVAVHFIDLDRFKEVNDMLGHDGGDFLLTTIGQRLNAVSRIEDLVARLGGDEFVVVQSGATGRQQAETFAQRILAILTEPIYFREQEIRTTVTIGVALAPEDGKTSDRLLKSADIALYNGKAQGRNCVRFFTPEMDAALQARLTLERLIRAAVATDGFVLHYQPVLEMSGERLVGFEALVRLPGPDGGLIAPGDFLPIAEDMRCIDKVGIWVLREACRTAMTWPEKLTVAVNLSPAQFEAGDISTVVAAALEESGLAPQRLELEITEHLLLGSSESTMKQLRELKALGVSIVMDDFGTGYSSLSYLWKFPFDKIKIDRSFMEGFADSGRDVETVVKTIIALGRELNMRVTVEGVETAKQVDFLYDADADQVQGFYFGYPVPASELAADVIKDLHKSVSADTKKEAKPRATSAAS
jgi:diguanylate cyclase (GGDEF)-like protein